MMSATKDMFLQFIDFKGTTSRKDFWLTILGYFFLSIIIGGIIVFANNLPGNTGTMIRHVWEIITILPLLSMGVRRIHDIGHSGWLILLGLIPIIGAIILLVLFCLPSK